MSPRILHKKNTQSIPLSESTAYIQRNAQEFNFIKTNIMAARRFLCTARRLVKYVNYFAHPHPAPKSANVAYIQYEYIARHACIHIDSNRIYAATKLI